MLTGTFQIYKLLNEYLDWRKKYLRSNKKLSLLTIFYVLFKQLNCSVSVSWLVILTFVIRMLESIKTYYENPIGNELLEWKSVRNILLLFKMILQSLHILSYLEKPFVYLFKGFRVIYVNISYLRSHFQRLIYLILSPERFVIFDQRGIHVDFHC